MSTSLFTKDPLDLTAGLHRLDAGCWIYMSARRIGVWEKWFTQTPYPPKENQLTWTPRLQTFQNSVPVAQCGRLEEKRKWIFHTLPPPCFLQLSFMQVNWLEISASQSSLITQTHDKLCSEFLRCVYLLWTECSTYKAKIHSSVSGLPQARPRWPWHPTASGRQPPY